MSSYGFCVRDFRGDVLYAEADTIGKATNLMAEATAVFRALQFVSRNTCQNIVLESDSLSILKFLKNEWRVPWEIIDVIEDTLELMQQKTVKLSHTFREGNQLADYLANYAMEQVGKSQFWGFGQLPSLARRICNIDKQQIPAIRIKTKNIQQIRL